MEFKSLNELNAYLQQNISKVLKNEVAEAAREEMSDTIKEVTFEQYTPDSYVRREEEGKLGLSSIENMQVEIIDDNTISITNETQGNDAYQGYHDGNIDAIIAYGQGYTWARSRIYAMQPFPRNFYEDTLERLKQNQAHVVAFKEGMKKLGIKVE